MVSAVFKFYFKVGVPLCNTRFND